MVVEPGTLDNPRCEWSNPVSKESGTKVRPATLCTMGKFLVSGLVVVLLIVTAVLVLRDDDPVLGSPRAAASAPLLHEPTEVAAVARPDARGSSAPDHLAMELHDGVAYVAYTTGAVLQVTAMGTDGELRWQEEFDTGTDIDSVSLAVTGAGVFAELRYTGYAATMAGFDLTTGDPAWDGWGNASQVVADRLITFREDDYTDNAYHLGTLEKAWSQPDAGGLNSLYPQQIWSDAPYDDGDAGQLTFAVSANESPDQYLVRVVKSTGAVAVVDLATGAERASGNVGDRVTAVVPFEDTVFVYRKTPRELKAYAATDLNAPLWSIEVPESADGALIDVCGRTTLCLMQVTGGGTPIYGVDASTGEIRWQTSEYATMLPPRTAGERAVVTHSGGTTLLDPMTGKVSHTFPSDRHAQPGGGVVIGFSGTSLELLEPGAAEPVPLGAAPTKSFVDGYCEWNREFAMCADEQDYTLYRYRG